MSFRTWHLVTVTVICLRRSKYTQSGPFALVATDLDLSIRRSAERAVADKIQASKPTTANKKAKCKKRDEGEIRLVVAYNSEDPSQPPEIMVGGNSDTFAPTLGKIVSHWSMLELETDLLITAILSYREDLDVSWKGRSFGRRWELLQDVWKDFASTEQFLLDEMHRANKSMKAARHVRNLIAHARMAFGVSNKGPWIRFRNRNPSFPWSKTYFQKEFDAVLLQIVDATGRIFRLTALDYASHFSKESLEILKFLPNMDHMRLPTD